MLCPWDQPTGGTLTQEWHFCMLVLVPKVSVTSVSRHVNMEDIMYSAVLTRGGNGGSIAKSLSFEHSGLLCCDPWSDSPGWLLIAPATLHQTDGSRGSLTWVQGKCNDMDAPEALCLPSCLSLLYPLFLLCNDLSVLPLLLFLTLLLLSPTNSCISQKCLCVCV